MKDLIQDILEHPFLSNEMTFRSSDVVITSRVRLARNLSDFPFPGRASSAQNRDVLSRCRDAVCDLRPMESGEFVPMEDLSDLERQVLVERHLISRELCESNGSAVMLSKDRSCAIMINEEDHFRMQVLLPGFSLKETWKTMSEIDTALERHLEFAFSLKLGYLTACPTNLGTGLRASMMLHLPGLVMSNLMDKVVRSVNQLGIAVRGLYGESSEASGSLFQISNQQTLGEEEGHIIERLSNVLKTVIEHETNARLKLVEGNKARIFDKIGRAFGILQNGHLLSSNEAMNSLSLVRLGLDLGLIPEEHRLMLDQLFIECQPAHIQLRAGAEISPDERDLLRATRVREAFQNLPKLGFDRFELSAL
ncbi:MAG: protein arginine kinase [Opitutales bacterium]|nr:protein arginine kinase [Opitutales bacterium]